jgi:hypothetical protein
MRGGKIAPPQKKRGLYGLLFLSKKRFANEKAVMYNIAVKLSIGQTCFTRAVVKMQLNAFSCMVNSK